VGTPDKEPSNTELLEAITALGTAQKAAQDGLLDRLSHLESEFKLVRSAVLTVTSEQLNLRARLDALEAEVRSIADTASVVSELRRIADALEKDRSTTG